MKLRMLHDYVAIEANVKTGTKGGIVLPERAQDNVATLEGKVVATRGTTLTVRIGDTVLFPQYEGGPAVDVEGKKLYIRKESNIFAIVEYAPES